MSARVAVVGGGHNALVAAAYLARAGLDVTVLERRDAVGGAAVSEEPFDGVAARLSRYAYLVGLMPAELVTDLGLDLELRSRSTASYTPYEGVAGPDGLLVETVPGEATASSFRRLTGGDDELAAWRELYGDVATLGAAVAPTLLGPLPTVAQVRGAVPPRVWADLVERPLGAAIERRFSSDLVRGVVATDALIGTFASLHDPTLRQNRCFLYHVIGGEWRVPVGGMGAVTAELERVARAAGATVRTGAEVTSIDAHDGGAHVGVGGDTLEVDWVLGAVAPYALARLLGDPPGEKPRGAQLKINLLLERLPRLRSGVDPAVAFAGTMHLHEGYENLERTYAELSGGVPGVRPNDPVSAMMRRTDPLPGEIYCHTLTDPSILSPDLAAAGAHTLTYFGLHLPLESLTHQDLRMQAWHLFSSGLERFLAEPLDPLLLRDAGGRACVEMRTPWDVEHELAMPGGHIFHGDLSWPWLPPGAPASTPSQRWGVATAHPRVLLAGSGAVRGGAVSGIGGHNAAHALLEMV